MKKLFTLLFLILIVLFISGSANSQNIANYTFSAASGSFTPLVGGTTGTLTGTTDEGAINNIPIGFTFYYMGVPYTTISAVTNGWLSFGQTVSFYAFTNALSSGGTRPILAPLWDDNDIVSSSNVTYTTTGIAGSRIFTIEYLNNEWNYNAPGAVISFQVLLYEGSGKIDFIYRQEAAAVVSGSASIGMTAVGTGSGNFVSLVNTGVSATASTTSETTILSTKPATGQTYSFTPQSTSPATPINITFTSVTGTGMTVNWVDNSATETYFILTRATDAGFTTNVVTTTVNSTTTAGTGSAYNSVIADLNFGTTYYFKVAAYNEGTAPSGELTGNQATPAGSLSGTKFVGTGTNTPDYATLSDAFTAINNSGLSGNLNLVLNTTYTTTDGAFPIAGPSASAVASYTVTIYPSVTGLSITSSSATGTINLNGSKNVIFDGRVGGTGILKDLIIENTNITGYAVQFINDANSNTIKYCTVKSVNINYSSGTIVFKTTTGTFGNDNNTIDNCDIRDGATTPSNGIYSSGTGTTTTHYNSGITISNCNIFNFYNSTSSLNAGVGIYINEYNMDWTISGNSFYQTETRRIFTNGEPTHNAILISSSTVNNTLISGNYIGGTAALCGGTAMTFSTTDYLVYRAIQLSVGFITPTTLQGNTIQNIAITTSSSSSAQSLISAVTGSINVTGNTLGSQSSTNSVTFTQSTHSTDAVFSGINAGTGTSGLLEGSINILNNTIGGIAAFSSSSGTLSLRGISMKGTFTSTISGNTIGSTTTANSISSNVVYGSLFGIFSASTTVVNNTTNNTVANLSYSGLGSSVQIVGILLQGSSDGAFTTTGNTVRNLTSNSANTGTNSLASVIGISHTAEISAGQTLSQNTIYGLSNNHSTSAVCVTGIHFAGPTSGTNVVSRNFIYGLNIVSTSAAADMRGINFTHGYTNVQNNMIRLGYDASGTALTTGIQITGLFDGSSVNRMYFNSVYIGGTEVGTQTGNTYAFHSTVTFNSRSYQNNIFVNGRSNSTTGGKHYAVRVAGTLPNPAGLNINYNLYQATGTGGILGFFNSIDVLNISAWRTATGQDNNSGNGDPNYIDPTSVIPNLHVQSPTPIEASGTNIASITEDFDGQTRSGLTPVDIGADAGNFVGGSDIFPPTISYTALGNGSTSNRVLTNFATITDNIGVSGGANAPRLYYKKSTDNDAFVGNTSGDNGWKYVVGTGPSLYSFGIDYGILHGGTGVVIGDVIQYFIVAQDDANNFSSLPKGATASGNPPVQSINGKSTTLDSYNITAAYEGTINVGSSETYTTLTGPGGLFSALNSGVVTGNINVNITSDITEPGTNSIDQWSEDDAGRFTLTIQPDAATMRTISGNVANGIFRLNGADRVIIDGRFGGSGRYLTLRNTNTSNPTITLLNDASNNIIRNSVIEGASTSVSNGVVFLSVGTSTGNLNNTITDNQIRDRSDGAGVPANLVYSQGFSATITNKGTILSNNEMFNFLTSGLYCTSTGNENWTISGNTIYQGAARITNISGITFNSLGTNTISQNTIRDMNTSADFTGINIANTYETNISRNKIYQTSVSGSNGTWFGINLVGFDLSSVITIANNQIVLIPSSNSSQTIYGIRDNSFNDNTITLYYNSVYLGGTATGSATWAFQRCSNTTTIFSAKNNIFFNNRTGGSVNHFACGDQSNGTGAFSVSNNLYVGTGITAENFMDRGTSGSGTAENFSAWVTGKSDISSYGSVASGIIYTDLFTDVTIGNLNIKNNNTACWNVKGKGIALTGQADDYSLTGIRSTTPGEPACIGSDEFTTSTTPPNSDPSGVPVEYTTTSYTNTGRTVGSIFWGAGGLVPTSVLFTYYSGSQPAGAGSVPKAFMYWDISPTGGIGYIYDMTLYYDEGQLDGIAENKLHPAKSTDNGTTWQPYLSEGNGPGQFQIDIVNNSITIYGLTGFSWFGLGDVDTPLPVNLTSFTSSINNRNVKLNWITESEFNNAGFDVERAEVRSQNLEFKKIGYIPGKGNSNSPVNYTFEDKKLDAGKFNYRLKQIDNNGNFTFFNLSNTVEVGIPTKFDISQNYPNPFNPVTKIDFALPLDSKVSIKLYDITGREVKTLVNDSRTAGYYTVQFNASDLSSGTYFYRIMTKSSGTDYIMTKKLVLIK